IISYIIFVTYILFFTCADAVSEERTYEGYSAYPIIFVHGINSNAKSAIICVTAGYFSSNYKNFDYTV
ncbi:MAG: hypothetical protein ABH952_10510, partial [Candidatus Omnitrophota bacterium]